MDGLKLLDRASEAGLRIVRDDDTLHIFGATEGQALAEEIRKHKTAVLKAWWRWQAARLIERVRNTQSRRAMQRLFDKTVAQKRYEGLDHPDAEHVAYGAVIVAIIERGTRLRGNRHL